MLRVCPLILHLDLYQWKDEEIMVLKDSDPQSPFYPTRQAVVRPPMWILEPG